MSVTVNGKAAFVYYISPTQINILTPPDALPASPQVVVTNSGVASAPFTAQAQPISPSFFVLRYPACRCRPSQWRPSRRGGSLCARLHLLTRETRRNHPDLRQWIRSDVDSRGFRRSAQGGTLSPLPVIKIGGITATVQFAGLVFPGEFQFNVVVPPNSSGGDQSIVATYNGATTQSGTVITIAGTVAPTSVTYYVSPTGNDSWSGTLAAPNAANTDGPFATFDRARAAVQVDQQDWADADNRPVPRRHLLSALDRDPHRGRLGLECDADPLSELSGRIARVQRRRASVELDEHRRKYVEDDAAAVDEIFREFVL